MANEKMPRRAKRPRNPLVPVVRQKPVKAFRSAKSYRRKPKHPGRAPD